MSGGSSSRRGSALLVVLGMLSFMIISGLAFSVYMRSTRMSSSFTRRTSATRQLAKAALAEAIDQIDRSIANDPHPGVRTQSRQYRQINVADTEETRKANIDNFWYHRVLIGRASTTQTETENASANAGNNQNQTYYPKLVNIDGGDEDTVPVLTLEALAHIPPPLVNEARYYGQRSPTACWQSFDFNAGRYAFIALDVSDYFDVNRILTAEARSSDSAHRVTFAHLFETGGEGNLHSGKPTAAATFEDSFLGNYRDVGDDGITFKNQPFVSMADFNLALGSGGYGNLNSPFVKYLSGGGDSFYGTNPGGEAWNAYSLMTFVADSLAVHETQANGSDTFNLDSDLQQPYPENFFDKSLTARSVSTILDDSISQPSWKYLAQQRVSAAGMLALADYLDKDDVPTSLAIPTTERVPMVCAVRPMPQDLKIVINREVSEDEEVIDGEDHYKQRTVTIRYKLEGDLFVDAWTAFPFRDQAGFTSSYQADCRVALFCSSREMLLRTSLPADKDSLRLTDYSANGLKDGIVNLCKRNSSCQTASVKTPTDAVKQMGEFNFGNAADVFSGDNADGILLAQATYRRKGELVPDSDPPQYTYPEPTLENCELVGAPTCDFTPIGSDGKVDSTFRATVIGNASGKYLKDLNLPKSIYFNLATWVAVRNSNNKVVDLVPACLSDDIDYNGMDYNEDFTEAANMCALGGLNAPLMKFVAKSGNATDILLLEQSDFLGTTKKELALELVHKEGVVVRDPRYNHAPENWFVATATIDAQGQYWLDNTGCGDAGCDGDIFMATSDQEYLQSIGELAFIPRFTALNAKPGDADVGDYIKNPERSGWTDFPTKGNEAQANMMWRTYNPFDGGDNMAGFEDLAEHFVHHGHGLRVNPYSDSPDVIMAAFANTPVSWRVAGYHDEGDSERVNLNPAAKDGSQEDAVDFNAKYAWSAYNTQGYKIKWENLEDVAEKFSNNVREYAKTGDSWQGALMDLFADNANEGTKKLCGVDLTEDEMYVVDKKALWGFWQDAFEPQQQLFLVFIRAEPMMLGGGLAGVTPPQLGARAMAVVWRNPYKTSNTLDPQNTNYRPHQTRVLFYRQFE